MELSLEHRIRERAYEIWTTNGRKHGEAERHWLAAEREILSECEIITPAGEKQPIRIRGERRQQTIIRPKKAANARQSA
jgi:hypothetical protein